MNKTRRVLAAVAGVALALGVALVSAAPASAATFGGYITWCSSSEKVTAKGTKSSSGGITVTAPQRSYSDTSSSSAVIILRGASQVGAWGVQGSGATAGSGYCS